VLPLAYMFVLAVIGYHSRRIRVPGATAHPCASWVAQAARNLVMVWVPNIASSHATWAYSCKRPPSRSRRVTLMSALTGSGSARSGLA
jgi:hypothetical protein